MSVCAGIVPDTWIVCGEGGNYCSEECMSDRTAEALVRMRIVLVTGSRHHKDHELIYDVLDASNYEIVVHGDATGADAIASKWARKRGLVEVPVQYIKSLGRKGGPIRNEVMVSVLCAWRDRGHDVRVEAFPLEDSVGTLRCIDEAVKAMLPVGVHRR